MIYSFKQGELTCIKKIFRLENLHGVGTPLWAGFFDKRRLLNTDYSHTLQQQSGGSIDTHSH